MSEHPINSLMNETMEKIRQLVDADTIIGKPIQAGCDTTIIPISRVCFGFASGGSDYVSKHARESAPACFGGGGGAGVTVTPVAFLIVDKTGTRILPINEQASTTADRLVELIPDAVSKVANFVQSHKQGEPENAEAPEEGAE